MEKLILIGAGGYAKSVLDSVDYYNYTMVGYVDEFCQEHEHLGHPVLARSLDELDNPEKYVYFISIGNNANRKNWYDKLRQKHLRIINVVDKSAIVSPRAKIGVGCFVGKMAIINSMSEIGNDCIINTKALIEHGCSLRDHVNMSTNSVINGDVVVGEGTFVGSCSVTRGQITIGSWSTVGAGAVVVKDVGDNLIVAGVPAKKLREGSMLG